MSNVSLAAASHNPCPSYAQPSPDLNAKYVPHPLRLEYSAGCGEAILSTDAYSSLSMRLRSAGPSFPPIRSELEIDQGRGRALPSRQLPAVLPEDE